MDKDAKARAHFGVGYDSLSAWGKSFIDHQDAKVVTEYNRTETDDVLYSAEKLAQQNEQLRQENSELWEDNTELKNELEDLRDELQAIHSSRGTRQRQD